MVVNGYWIAESFLKEEVLGKVIYWYLVLWALMWIVVSLL